MTQVSEISARLRDIRLRSKLSAREVARRLDVPLSTYQHLEYRYKKPFLTRDQAEALARAYSGTGIKAAEVMELAGIDGETPAIKAETNDLVPVFDLSASAGIGMQGYESAAHSMAFPPGYLSKLTRAAPVNLVIISVKGDSMAPTLLDGDVVMIDLTKRNVDFDGLFVFRFGHALHIKRVSRSATPDHIIAASDNRALYDPIEYAASDVDVIGRVVWFGRRV